MEVKFGNCKYDGEVMTLPNGVQVRGLKGAGFLNRDDMPFDELVKCCISHSCDGSNNYYFRVKYEDTFFDRVYVVDETGKYYYIDTHKIRTLFSTCGWQKSNMNWWSDILWEGNSFRILDVDDVPRSIRHDIADNNKDIALITTDDGQYAVNPRKYLLHGKLHCDSAILFINVLKELDAMAKNLLGINVSSSLRNCGRSVYNDSKYTVANQGDHYLLTYYLYDENGIDVPLKVHLKVNKTTLWVEDIYSADIVFARVKLGNDSAFLSALSSSLIGMFHAWRRVAKGMNCNEDYLEVVRGSTEMYFDKQPVVLGDLTYEEKPFMDFNAYFGASVINRGNGFYNEKGINNLTGKRAICVVF